MSDIPREILTAAAVAIHDADCPDRTCSGSALGHCYRLAAAALDAAGPLIAAAERRRGEALVVQAQDYARAESERADKLAALALRALNQCHALERDDSASYLDEWSMALDQLESAAGEMSPPGSDPLEGAYQAAIKAERERISNGAGNLKFTLSRPGNGPAQGQSFDVVPLAELLKLIGGDGG